MRGFFGFVIAGLSLPLLCGSLFAVLFITLVGLTIPQLPAWAQGDVTTWLLNGTPGSSLPGEPGSSTGGGQIPAAGYVGTESFACLLPPEIGYLTDRYGVPRGRYIHTGIDYGTYHQAVLVQTPMGGQVTYAGWSQAGYGNLVVIENAGYQVYLAHNTDFFVAAGQIVTAGEVVALSGTTGASSGYHVHFEVRVWVEPPGGAGWWSSRDPNLVYLPGQAEPCDWYALAISPGAGGD